MEAGESSPVASSRCPCILILSIPQLGLGLKEELAQGATICGGVWLYCGYIAPSRG